MTTRHDPTMGRPGAILALVVSTVALLLLVVLAALAIGAAFEVLRGLGADPLGRALLLFASGACTGAAIEIARRRLASSRGRGGRRPMARPR